MHLLAELRDNNTGGTGRDSRSFEPDSGAPVAQQRRDGAR
jgi:hypothetical protein